MNRASMRKKLLIGTTNLSKIEEVKKYLIDIGWELVTLEEIGFTDKAPETGSSFEENAIMKAKFYAQKTGLTTLADDGGLEVDALYGAPGLYSRRAEGGKELSQYELIPRLMEKMEGIPTENRGAQFRIVIALAFPAGETKTVEESVRGVIAETPSPVRLPGYPYRSIFFLPQFGKYFSELTDAEHERVNHRKRALERIKGMLNGNGLI